MKKGMNDIKPTNTIFRERFIKARIDVADIYETKGNNRKHIIPIRVDLINILSISILRDTEKAFILSGTDIVSRVRVVSGGSVVVGQLLGWVLKKPRD